MDCDEALNVVSPTAAADGLDGVGGIDVLVVEDDNDDFFLVDELLRSQLPVRAEQAASVEEARQAIARKDFHVILLDYSLGASTGLDLLEELRGREINTPVIFLTGHGGEEIAVRALKSGATDYLPKRRLNAAALASSVRHALALREKDAAVRQAREALSVREREYRMLFENANDAIVIIDAESEAILAANPAAARLYECPEEQLTGTSLIEFSTDILQGRAAIEQCLATGRLSNHETIHVTRQGRRVHILANASVIEYRGKAALLCAFRDVSEQKSAEEKLRESEQRYRTLFQRNLAGVFRAGGDGTLLEANEAFIRMLGYESSAEVTGQRLGVLCAAAGFVEPWCAELVSAGQLINRELRVLRKDGATAYLLANLVLLRDSDGAPEFIEGTALDITQRRQLEAQLLHSQKMEAIGQLAGGIAHDFNNLLMVIRSYAELMMERTGAGLPPQRPNNGDPGPRSPGSSGGELDAILKAADRGGALIRQLLTFGRKDSPAAAAGSGFSPRLLDINSALESILNVLPRALGEDVRVELRAAAGLWQVKADAVQIEQLVLNLAVNARDAMPGGGRLVLETSNVVLDGEYVKMHAGVAAGEYVMLTVSDTGEGIAREDLPRIFEPFFTTKERGKGTGLGLSTVYGIVQQSGGFIWVYSEPGEGTVFKIYLPRATEAAIARRVGAAGAGTETPDTGTETILLVEDEEAVRSAASQYLGLRGYSVLEAGCGEEALRICQNHTGPIHLLITDAVMPGMSGSALARQVSARLPGIRMIYVSGYTEATMGEHGFLAPQSANGGAGDATVSSAPAGSHSTPGFGMHAWSFLQKPFSLAVLARKVRELLDGPMADEKRVA